MEKLEIFRKRLNKLDIEIEYAVNYPWVYLNKINGRVVKEKYEANHGFTVAFLPIRKNKPLVFTELKVIFELIRKYCNL